MFKKLFVNRVDIMLSVFNHKTNKQTTTQKNPKWQGKILELMDMFITWIVVMEVGVDTYV